MEFDSASTGYTQQVLLERIEKLEKDLAEERRLRSEENEQLQRLQEQDSLLVATQRTFWRCVENEDMPFYFLIVQPQAAWQHYTGQPWEQYRHAGWLNALHPDDQAAFQKDWSACCSRGKDRFQSRFRLWSGLHRAYRSVFFQAMLVPDDLERKAWVGNWVDLVAVNSESATFSATFSDSDKAALALKCGTAGVWVWDLQRDHIEWDDRVQRLFGLAPGVFGGKFEDYLGFVHPEDRSLLQSAIEDSIAHLTDFLCEYRVVHPDGIVRYLSSRGSVLLDEEKGPRQMAGISMDITQLRQHSHSQLVNMQRTAEADRSRANVAEKDQHRMEEFVNTVCHEIRNPLTGLKGSLEWLKDIRDRLTGLAKADLSKEEILEQVREAREFLHDAIETNQYCISHQIAIVDDVLDYSKLQAGKLELSSVPFDPVAEIQSSAKMFRSRTLEKNLKLVLQVPRQRWLLRGDPARFKMILVNLLSNAIKFTKEGSIVITAIIEKLMPTAEEEAPKLSLSVSVKDTGFGMTAEQQAQLFEKFTQVGVNRFSAFGGSGLGLVISKNFATLMGGNILVESELGKGSTFTLKLVGEEADLYERRSSFDERYCSRDSGSLRSDRLSGQPSVDLPGLPPVSSSSSKEQEGSPTTAFGDLPGRNSGRYRRALVVEDNPMNAKVLTWLLFKKGIAVETALNGPDALEKLAKSNASGARFDVCFMDIWLDTNLTGFEVAKLVRNSEAQTGSPRLTIIGVSGEKNETNVRQAFACGFDDFVAKPFTKETLWEKLDRWLSLQSGAQVSSSGILPGTTTTPSPSSTSSSSSSNS